MDKYRLRAQLDIVETRVIRLALAHTRGDVRAASRLLPYAERTLHARLQRLCIDPDEYRTMQIVADGAPVTP